MGILGWIGIAALFYAAAEYEHMPPWPWAIASFLISGTVDGVLPFSFIFILPAQFVLFLIFWYAHAKHEDQFEVDRAARQQASQRERHDRITAAHRQAAADPSIAAREAQRAAAEEAAAQERKERVRKAREEREAEERAQREKRQES
jgi:hypothetical protein